MYKRPGKAKYQAVTISLPPYVIEALDRRTQHAYPHSRSAVVAELLSAALSNDDGFVAAREAFDKEVFLANPVVKGAKLVNVIRRP